MSIGCIVLQPGYGGVTDGQRRRLGYVLSGSTSTEALFEPVQHAESHVREGMLVVIEPGGGEPRYLGLITRLEVHHEMYEPGSLWSESIRRGQLPPNEAARRYMLARVSIHGVIAGNGLKTPDRPPMPGAEVYEAEPGDLKPLYGYMPGRELPDNIVEVGVLYGYSGGNAPPASLNLDRLPMHMAVLGVTGSGKSNTIGLILERLGAKDGVKVGSFSAKTVPAFVIDANGDYLDYYEKPELLPSYKVVRLVFSNAVEGVPRVKRAELGEIRVDLNIFLGSSSELAEAIYAVVRGGNVEGLELQLNLLARLIDIIAGDVPPPGELSGAVEEVKSYCSLGDSLDLNTLFRRADCIQKLIGIIDLMDEHKATKAAVARTLRTFHEIMARRYSILAYPGASMALTEDFVDKVTEPRRPHLVIIDFSPDGAPGVELRLKQFIVYHLARLLLSRFVHYKTKKETRVAMLVVEEAQNYIPNQREYPIGFSVARGYLALAATQGRKFGLSLVLVTQRPSFVDPVVLSMMNTFIIHRVASGDRRFVQLATGGLPGPIASRLPLLETGVAVITGQMSPFPYPILARIERRRSHEAGSV